MRTTQSLTGRRLLALLLAALLLLACVPATADLQPDTTVYGCVTVEQVRLRQNASKTAGYWEMLPQGWVMTILDSTTVQGTLWYHVRGNLPSAMNSTYTGYILGECFRPLTMDETTVWLNNPTQGILPGDPLEPNRPAPSEANLKAAGGWIVTTVTGANLRISPDASADTVVILPHSAVLQVSGYTSGWYYASYETLKGYVSEAYVRSATADEVNGFVNGTTPAAAPASTPVSGTHASVTVGATETITLRAMPIRSGLALDYIPGGASVIVTEIDGDWAAVIYGQKAGYVLKEYLSVTGSTAQAYNPSSPASSILGTGMMATVSVGSGTLALLKEASEDADRLKSIPNRTVLYIEEAGALWSRTTYAGKTGYVDSAFLRFASSGDDYAPYIIITSAKSVNVRQEARKAAKVISYAGKGEVYPLWASPWTNDGYNWYPATVNGKNAYIRSDTCRLMTISEYDAHSEGSRTPAPTATPVPPASNIIESLSSALNIRAAATTSSKSLGKLHLRDQIAFTGISIVNGEEWYKVTYRGDTGFVSGKFVRVLSNEEASKSSAKTPTPKPTATPIPIPAGLTDTAYTTMKSVYVRSENTMNSASVTKIAKKGTYVTWTGETKKDKGKENFTWYHIEYRNLSGWIRGDLLHVMTRNEWENAFSTPVPTVPVTAAPTARPTPIVVTPVPTPTPKPSSMLLTDIAYTIKSNIFLRKENSMKSTSVTKIYNTHTYVNLLDDIKQDKNGENYTWYHVNYSGKTGWIRSDLLHVMTNAEWEEEFIVYPTPAPAATLTPQPPVIDDDDLGPYVAYDNLRYGSSGTQVTKLQQALYEQGYLSPANVSGTYNDATRQAVRTFQQDNGLTVDGVAGQLTQSTLFGTVAYDTTLYPIEKVTWTVANKAWPRGSVATITDVKTGLSFAAKRYAGGSHADVEPLTAADTAIMCRIYGVSESQEIAENNLYQRRPLWVTVNGRSLAASMYGVPHNPSGDTLPDNDYTGQFCVHFVNSRVHRTNEVDRDHMAAIDYAYANAPTKK